MKREKSKENVEVNDNDTNFTDKELFEIDLLKQQMFGAILGVYAELLFFKASFEEIQEIYNKHNNSKSEFINSNNTFLESAQLFLISQFIFTKVSFQFYYLLVNENIENKTYVDLSAEERINISCVLNSIGNIYFLDAIEEICARSADEPVLGD